LLKNRYIAQKLKFCSKIEISLYTLSYECKLHFWSKPKILLKNQNVAIKLKWGKIEILVKNYFCQQLKFPTNIILFKNFRNLVKNLDYGLNLKFWYTLWNFKLWLHVIGSHFYNSTSVYTPGQICEAVNGNFCILAEKVDFAAE